MPNIDVNNTGGIDFSPFHLICSMHLDTKIVDLFWKSFDIDPYLKDRLNRIDALELALSRGNSFIVEYLIHNVVDMKRYDVFNLCSLCWQYGKLVNLKILIKFEIMNSSKNDVINKIKQLKYIREKFIQTALSIADEFPE